MTRVWGVCRFESLKPVHHAADLVVTFESASLVNGYRDPLRAAENLDDNSIDQRADDDLAIDVACRAAMP